MSLGYNKKTGEYRDNIFGKMEKTAGALSAIRHPLRTLVDYADPDGAYGARFGRKGDEIIDKVGTPVVGALASATLGPEAGPIVGLLGKGYAFTNRYEETQRERFVASTIPDARPGYDSQTYLNQANQTKKTKGLGAVGKIAGSALPYLL